MPGARPRKEAIWNEAVLLTPVSHAGVIAAFGEVLAPLDEEIHYKHVRPMLRAVIRRLRAMDDPQEGGSVVGFGPR